MGDGALRSSHVLANGSAYNLRLSTDGATRYTAVPIQEGTSKGLPARASPTATASAHRRRLSWANLYPFDSTDLQFWLEATA